jgi:hypothetical protein
MAKKKDLNNVRSVYTERESQLIDYCMMYESSGSPGLPGHTLMIIIGKMFKQLQYFKNLVDSAKEGAE